MSEEPSTTRSVADTIDVFNNKFGKCVTYCTVAVAVTRPSVAVRAVLPLASTRNKTGAIRSGD